MMFTAPTHFLRSSLTQFPEVADGGCSPAADEVVVPTQTDDGGQLTDIANWNRQHRELRAMVRRLPVSHPVRD